VLDFGLLASPESNLLMTGNWGPNGIEYDEPNLSERHLDWWSGFNKHHNADLDPPTGDGTDIHGGGNSVYLAANMSRGEGMVRELDAAYVDIDFARRTATAVFTATTRATRHVHRGGGPEQHRLVKQNVMAKGAVSTCMCTESQFFATSRAQGALPAAERHALHQSRGCDHRLGHNMVTHAPGAGAWLIKNSWGTGWNTPEGGFFWISYYDKFATRYRHSTAARSTSTTW
jgi:C1A family cysteine protease